MDKAIEHQFEIIPNTLTSIPGIGKVYSAGIIAEIGNIHRFNSQASVAKFAGLVWTQNQSGEFEAEHSRMIKSGNRYLRYYLLEAANSVRRCDSEFRRYYDLKYQEVNKYQHKRALALTARGVHAFRLQRLRQRAPPFPCCPGRTSGRFRYRLPDRCRTGPDAFGVLGSADDAADGCAWRRSADPACPAAPA